MCAQVLDRQLSRGMSASDSAKVIRHGNTLPNSPRGRLANPPLQQIIQRATAILEVARYILNIGGSYDAGSPTRSLYHFKLLIALVDEIGFYLAQECFWHNPAKLPSPTEWVNVRRFRIKDSVEYVWWLSPSAWPYADNRQVLVPYSEDMKRLI